MAKSLGEIGMSNLNSGTNAALNNDEMAALRSATLTVWTDWSRNAMDGGTPAKARELRSVAVVDTANGKAFQ